MRRIGRRQHPLDRAAIAECHGRARRSIIPFTPAAEIFADLLRAVDVAKMVDLVGQRPFECVEQRRFPEAIASMNDENGRLGRQVDIELSKASKLRETDVGEVEAVVHHEGSRAVVRAATKLSGSSWIWFARPIHCAAAS